MRKERRVRKEAKKRPEKTKPVNHPASKNAVKGKINGGQKQELLKLALKIKAVDSSLKADRFDRLEGLIQNTLKRITESGSGGKGGSNSGTGSKSGSGGSDLDKKSAGSGDSEIIRGDDGEGDL